jgi:geranylgeranylglycerol-phosphate geranylgeranyltransferase
MDYPGFIRVTNCFGAALASLIGSVLAIGSVSLPHEAFYAMVVVSLATAGGMVANNYFDRKIDKDGTIARGEISPRNAAILAAVLFTVAIAITLLTLPVLAIAIGVFNGILLIIYTPWLAPMGLVGNLAVAYLSASAFLFGAAAVGSLEVALILVLLAFFASVGREVVKDIEDMEKDKSRRKTLPMRIGTRKAALVALLFLILAVLVSPLPYVMGFFGLPYILAVLLPDFMFLWAGFLIYSSRKLATRSQDIIKKGMWLGMLAFLVGVFF